jgi:hypothetical protein
MTYFPEPAWSNIVSYLVDPYKRDREAHAEVWQNISPCRLQYEYDGNGAHPNGPRIDILYTFVCQDGFYEDALSYHKKCSMHPHSDMPTEYEGHAFPLDILSFDHGQLTGR